MRRLDLAAILGLVGVVCFAQSRNLQGFRGARGGEWAETQGGVDDPRTAREVESHSLGTPNWTNTPALSKDVFTFVRLHYSVNGAHGFGGSGPNRWRIDFPDSDLNFSYRLQQMTSIKVDPDARVLRITDKELFDFPFVYIVEPGRLTFTDEEIPILRRYLLNGGFLMVDDFWGEREWSAFQEEMKKVFPDREAQELPIEHPIFHCVFDIQTKPMIPGLPHYERGQTTEREDATEAHYKGIFDDKNRLMVMICHNTDLGDGWEREGENAGYFRDFAEKYAYPIGINVIYYAMTH
jgi:hypothetical protein